MKDFSFGYCTNVHAGISLEQAKQNLLAISARVRDQVSPEGRLPVGLWLAEQAAFQLESPNQIEEFANWLSEHRLKAYTFNGFPQGDFHQNVVKHAVYLPTWLEESRLVYTKKLADILAGLLDTAHSGSISTLPLGWPHRTWQESDFQLASQQLRRLAEHLDGLAQRTGHEIVLAIEPEPGCVLDTAPKLTNFLTQYVFEAAPAYTRRHITACHDICHSAVMFESQTAALDLYRNSGIRVGKVQVSSAIEVPWMVYQDKQQLLDATLTQLRSFNEPRYLHQTTREQSTGAEQLQMVDDLGLALDTWLDAHTWPSTPWRIHFHVPIFVEKFGNLLATQADIGQVVSIMTQHASAKVDDAAWFTGDYEVETYAWGVLPQELQVPDLAEGIARELKYFQTVLETNQQ